MFNVRNTFRSAAPTISWLRCYLLRGAVSDNVANRQQQSPVDAFQLENRVLYSASPFPVDLIDTSDSIEPIDLAQNQFEAAPEAIEYSLLGDLSGQDGEAQAIGAIDFASELLLLEQGNTLEPSIELVFVDESVEGYEALIADIFNQESADRNFQIITLNSNEDGIAQITDVLRQYENVDAIHLVSHGSGGELQLGNTSLSNQNIAGYQDEISGWNAALKSDADLLIYGCDLASNADGIELINELGALCDCDVAASEDVTGSSSLGGDWDLEFTSGVIETEIAFSAEIESSWVGKLAIINVTQFGDNVNGNVTSVATLTAGGGDGGDGISLREAILAVNNDAGGDTINLAAGTYTLSGAAGDDLAASGDLDILKDVTIVGVDAASTIIDGGGVDRVFEVLAGTLDMSDVTIRGGNVAASGGGISVADELNLTRVIVTGNYGTRGGGIHNQGTVSLTDVAITGNEATTSDGGGMNIGTSSVSTTMEWVEISGNTGEDGGGVYVQNNTNTFTNVTISGNTARDSGGAIYVQGGSMTMTNGTVVHNLALSGTAGIRTFGGGDATLENTIVHNPTGGNLQGSFNSLGNNIDSDLTTELSDPSDQFNVTPDLGNLQNNGGFTQTHALLTGGTAITIDRVGVTGAPTVDQRGFARDATPDIGAYEFGATATTLWLTSNVDVASPSGAPGLDSWTAGEVLSFGGPNLTFDPTGNPADTTDGMFASVFNLDDLVQDSDAWLNGLHYVQSNITIGSGANEFELFAGDVLFSTQDSETLQSTNSLSVTSFDLAVYQPDTPGDYSSGIFTLLLDGSQIPQIDLSIHGLTLVESDTMIGDTTLQAGTFLLVDADDTNIYHYTADGVGDLTTSGTWSTLIEGTDINIGQYQRSIELIETTTVLGGTVLAEGTLLMSVNNNDTVGDNNLSVQREDIFYLTVSKTEWDQATTVANATLLLDGSDVGMVTGAERFHGLSLLSGGPVTNDAPTDITPNSFNVNENINTSGGYSVGTLTATDPDTGESFTYSIEAGGDGAKFTIGGAGSDELILDDAVLDFETKPSYTVNVRVTDSAMNTYDETLTVNVNDLNDAPTANNDTYATNQDTTLVTNAGTGLLFNDSDPDGDPLSTYVVDGPTNGVLGFDPLGAINATNLTNDSGEDDQPVFSPDGTKIAFRSNRTGFYEIYIMDVSDLSVTQLTFDGATAGLPTWSPDGTQLAFHSDLDGDDEIYTINVNGTGQTQRTFDSDLNKQANWSPDGTKIAFRSNRDGNNEIYSLSTSDWSQTRLTTDAGQDNNPSWSPDGSQIVFTTNRDGNFEIYSMDANGDFPTRLTTDAGNDRAPRFSPDGSKIVFQSDRDGDTEIFAMDAGGGNEIQITNNVFVDGDPTWSPDGTKLLFDSNRSGNTEIYIVDLLFDGTFTYTPDSGYTGVESFTYVANDGNLDSNIATATITVNATQSISGTVYEDIDGDGDVLDDGTGSAGVTVGLYLDDGTVAGQIDASDSLIGTDTTDGSGNYSFTGLTDATYWVVVDSTTIDPNAGFNGSFLSGDAWAEQTYGVAGSVSFEGSYSYAASAGGFYGGMQSETSDNTAALTTAEHVTRVIVTGSDVANVDSGFSFNAITNTGDDGAISGPSIQGSLRQFIFNANAIDNTLHGLNTSQFTIPTTDSNYNLSGNGEYTITPTVALPNITDAVVINGYSQAGASANTLAVGNDASLQIIINGAPAPNNTDGLTITGGGSTITGLVIQGFRGDGIAISGAGGNTIQGNFIGTDETGTIDVGNTGRGIYVTSSNNVIGGTATSDRNLISGNNSGGIRFDGLATIGNTQNNLVQGNYIGTTGDGMSALGNGGAGVHILNKATGNLIGGSANGAENLIAASAQDGVVITNVDTTGNIVQGNLIGVDVTGASSLALSNSGGIAVTGSAAQNTIGGVLAGEGNTIASLAVGTHGIELTGGGTGIEISGNSIFDVGGDGISIEPGSDTNNEYTPATLTSATTTGASLSVNGSFTEVSLAGQNVVVEYFSSPGTVTDEGKFFLGTETLLADGTGVVTISSSFAATVAVGDSITVTIRDAANNTTVFSNSVQAVTGGNTEQVLATNNLLTLDEGATAIITNLLLASTDAEQTPSQLVYTVTGIPGTGTLRLSATPLIVTNTFTQDDIDNNRITYIHNGDENFTDSFTFDVDDGIGGTTSGTFNININPINDNNPVADSESFTVLEGGTATESDLDAGTSLLDGDTDIDLPNDTLTVNTTPTVDATYGLLTLSANGTFSYVHDGSENFNDTFTYEVTDALGNTDTAVVSITITPVNDNNPVADTESFTVLEGGTATEADLDTGTSLLDGDTDIDLPNDTLTVNTTPTIDATYGLLTLNANGTFNYVHDGSENFSDSFTYEVADALGNTDTAVVSITITPVNDNNPFADTESFTVAEGGTATQADLDAGTSLLDGDTDLDLPNDTLTVNTTPTVDATYGVLTLNANGTFSYVHDGSENFNDTFTYEVADALGNTDTAVVLITITPVNDNNPVADTESFTVAQGGTATQTALDAGASLLDGDTDIDLPNDTLTVNTTPVVDVSNGSLTLNSNGTFSYTHDGSPNFSDSFVYEVTDALGNTDTATVTITITNGSPPVADSESFTVAEGGTATESDLDLGTTLLDGDTDADLPVDTLTVNTTPAIGPSFGAVTLNANGTFSYTHDGSENFTDSFTYEVTDSFGNSDTATVTITITPINDNPPVADTESFTVAEGGTATEADLDVGSNLLDGDTDIDLPNDTLSVNTIPVVDTANGVLTLNANGTFSYAHDGSENFNDTFTYEVTDALGNVDVAVVTITITPDNDNNPVADSESFTVLEGGTATEADLDAGINLLDGDTDLDSPNDSLIINPMPIVDVSHGTLTLFANGTFNYTHNGSENFSDSFTYELIDAVGNTDTAVVTITITPDNDNNPAADTESFTVLEGGAATEADLDAGTNLLDGDTDLDLPNDSLAVNTAPVIDTTYGLLTLNANGTFSYVHDGSENFSDTFTYEVSDALGNTDTATVTITITPVNDNTPVADTESFTVLEGGTATEADLDTGASLLDGDTDIDLPNDLLTVNTTPVIDTTYGFLTLNANGTFSYVHDGSENFSDTFTYEVSDALGNTDTAVVTITITQVNDNAPIADNESFTVAEGGTATEADLDTGTSLLDGDTDLDLPNDTLTVNATPVVDVAHGTLTLNTDGTFNYVHDGSENFTDAFSYQVIDSFGNADIATATITISAIDESPIAVNDSYATFSRSEFVSTIVVTANDADPEGAALSWAVVANPTNGTLSTNPDGSFSYTPNAGFFGVDTFVYQVSDGTSAPAMASVSINVLSLNGPLPPAAERGIDPPTVKEPVEVEDVPATSIIDELNAEVPVTIQAIQPEFTVTPESTSKPIDFTIVETSKTETVEPDSTTLLPSFASANYANGNARSASSTEIVSAIPMLLSDVAVGAFDSIRQEMSNEDIFDQAVIGTTMFASASLSVGYVAWLIRGGVLMSSVLSSLPAWRMVDPLPVLGYLDEDDEEVDDDSLEQIVAKSNLKHQETTAHAELKS